ncbi:unnamed protein product, partial [Mesorhabditis belari]|uniref:SXP/RAL-2 family protein Ani s 5-like cation-binding domain-containing protein n=1 Tax=Mesorhabditis belari TaxID=2138241 RepID=A0AAF3EL92_9BILA
MFKFVLFTSLLVAACVARPGFLHESRKRRAVGDVLKNAADQIQNVPTETLHEVVMLGNLDNVAEVVQHEIGANANFSKSLLAIVRNPNSTRAEIKTKLDELIAEQPATAKAILEDVEKIAENRIQQVKERVVKVVNELPKMANQMSAIINNSSLTIAQSVIQAREIESHYDAATKRAYKAMIASTLLTVFEEAGDLDDASISVGFVEP